MRYGLLSDVHANLPALRAALAALRSLGAERYVCAGDVVGYGPHPHACIEEIAALKPVWVLGNHELMLLDRVPMTAAGPLARMTLEWTRSVLSSETMSQLAALPLTTHFGHDGVVTHASLVEPLRRVRTKEQVDAELRVLRRDHAGGSLLVIGHTHRAMIATWSSARRPRAHRGVVTLDAAVPHLVNPGSIGQSRGFVAGARAALLDTETRTLQLVHVRYDAASVDRDLARAGLPTGTHSRSPLTRVRERVQRRSRSLVALVRRSVARARS